ncbi:palmitoyltransferase ZDHHC23 isoform X2 [Bradysia coprophila]|nr:palmitoyltransferase ZDHHC23 isoform X2 [Bradysia coprophila]
MLLTFQDRLRIPWRGGAKQISFEATIPIVLLPVSLFVAAVNVYCCIATCLVIPLFLGYTYYCLRSIFPRTKFFFLWSFWSVAYLCILFESTVPLMEILPEENAVLILMIVAAMFCFYKVKLRAPLNHVVQSDTDIDNLPDITEEQTTLLIDDDGESDESEANPNICSKCHKYTPPRTFHCAICQACIVKRDHHNIWLDACVGESNHRFFFFGCIISIMALILGTNLALTSICHPFSIGRIFGIPIFLPDDCSEVFDQFDVALCFVGSIYGIMLAICLTMVILQQIFFISKGVTGTEWHRGDVSSRKNCYVNWKIFCCWLR